MISALAISSGALAHGYIKAPESRVFKCTAAAGMKNSNCGSMMYEPQSVEGVSGFPLLHPADGKLASGAKRGAELLDAQGENRWAKNQISAGKNNFTWYFTAPHRTNNWRYYITKNGWNSNKPLTRDSFELVPFCQIEGHGQIPATEVTHSCNVPERNGYHVIYGIWEIADTSNSFYQVIDVNFGDNGAVSEWEAQLSGNFSDVKLNEGDSVIVHFFNREGEVINRQIELSIADDMKGSQEQWMYDLAKKINETYSDIRVGVKDKNGKVTPEHSTANRVYIKKDSDLIRFETTVKLSEIKERASVTDVQVDKINNGKATLKFSVNVSGDVTFKAHIRDNHDNEIAYYDQDLEDTTQQISIDLTNVKPGCHWLEYIVTNKAGRTVKQGKEHLKLESADNEKPATYDFVFPENFKSYKAGTIVLQPKDNKTYECKPFPYSGYCVQWSQHATQFEPGTGSNWQDAWVLKK